MTKPTYQDASMMIQLAQWGATIGLNDATNWMWSDQFIEDYAEFGKKYPPGSQGWANAAKVCNYFETLGTLYKHGLFNEELLFDWLAVSFVWNRIKGYALGIREQSGLASMYENFEAMAMAQK